MKGHLASERVLGREKRRKVGNEGYEGRMRMRERERGRERERERERERL